jgi:5-methylcytosine-specific restriction endonuclease McrA
MASVTLEIETTRDIARQLLRHRSFTFQEFCVAEGTNIRIDFGTGTRLMKIEDLYKRFKGKYWNRSNNNVRVYDEKSGQIISAKIKEVFDTGVKDVWELTLDNGKKIRSTKEHKFLTTDGFKPLGEVSNDDFIGCNGVAGYQSKDWLVKAKQVCIANGTGLDGIADLAGVSTHTIRKWLAKNKVQFTKKEVAQYTQVWNKGLPSTQQPRYNKTTPEATRVKQRASAKKGQDSSFYTGAGRSWSKEVRDYWYKRKLELFNECRGICAVTSVKFEKPEQMEIDHAIPIHKRPDLAMERSNIRLISTEEHYKKSAEESRLRWLTPSWHKVTSIEYVGKVQTYDMEIDHDSHNYVANGVITHNSQRYADPVKELRFVTREARLQDTKNRQNSLDLDLSKDEQRLLEYRWEQMQQNIIDRVKDAYVWAVEHGIAKEQARAILPEGLTMSRLYVQGSVRSFIHYIEVRTDESTQKEHRVLAKAISDVIGTIFKVTE